MIIELIGKELELFLSSKIKIRLKSHKNIKKILIKKFRHLFYLNIKLSDLSAYQTVTLFYGQVLGLFILDIEFPTNNVSGDIDKYRNKFLDYLKQNATTKQMNYYLHQLNNYLNIPKKSPMQCLVIFQDRFNQLNITIIDPDKNILDSITLDALLLNDSWYNICFEIAKLLINYDINQVICTVHNNFQKILLLILNNIKNNYQDLDFNTVTVTSLGALAFANHKDILHRYSTDTEAHRATVFLAMHFWNPRDAFSLLNEDELIFDPLQKVFDQNTWCKKIKKLIHSEEVKQSINKNISWNNALSAAFEKINFKTND